MRKRSLLRKTMIVLVISIMGLALLSLTAKRPESLGVRNGQFTAISESRSTVSTQHSNPSNKFEPLRLGELSSIEWVQKIANVIEDLPRTMIVKKTDNYLHAEFRSLIFRFVDDVEFYVDESNACVQFRSAPRIGDYDMGVNRRRLENIVELLK